MKILEQYLKVLIIIIGFSAFSANAAIVTSISKIGGSPGNIINDVVPLPPTAADQMRFFRGFRTLEYRYDVYLTFSDKSSLLLDFSVETENTEPSDILFNFIVLNNTVETWDEFEFITFDERVNASGGSAAGIDAYRTVTILSNVGINDALPFEERFLWFNGSQMPGSTVTFPAVLRVADETFGGKVSLSPIAAPPFPLPPALMSEPFSIGYFVIFGVAALIARFASSDFASVISTKFNIRRGYT